MKRRGTDDRQARQPQGWWQQYLAWSGKKTSAQQKPRIRLRLLLLLWVWAALMFVVVDLFYNVSEFDRIRPSAPLYQAMREVAHEVVGEPVVDWSRLDQPRDAALAVQGPLPKPPAGFRGSQLHWRVKRNDLDEAEMADALTNLKSLARAEGIAVLRHVRLRPDIALAPSLAQAADTLPADPIVCAYYSAACLSVLRAMVEHAGAALGSPTESNDWRDPRSIVLESQVARDLLEKGLGAEARRVVEHGPDLDHSAWAGVLFSLEGFERAFPDFRRSENCARILAEIEGALLAELGEAVEPRPGYRGGVGAIRLAAWIGSPALLDLLVRLFANHESLAKKLPTPRQENELIACDEIVRCIAGKGSAPNQADLARLLAEELGWQRGEAMRRRLWRYASVLVRARVIDVASIRTLAGAAAHDEFENAYRDAIRRELEAGLERPAGG